MEIKRTETGFIVETENERWDIHKDGEWWLFDPLSFDPGIRYGEYSNHYTSFEACFDGLMEWLSNEVAI